MTTDLRNRLARLRIDIEDDVATRHLAAITAELQAAPARPAPSRRAMRRNDPRYPVPWESTFAFWAR